MNSRLKKLLEGLAFFIVIAIIPYYWVGRNLLPLDALGRTKAPGAFAEIDDGLIHYKWSGPETGQIIVFIHGFSTPSFVFDQNASVLAENGFRVLQYDHFGRGWSDRPDVKYDADFYDRELVQLIEHLNIEQKIGLVGYSMEGIIAANFTMRHPERVSRLCLLAPTGLEVNGDKSFAKHLLNTPFLGDWIWTIFGRSILINDTQYDETGLDKEARLQGDISVQMDYAGYFPALLSTLRHLEMSDQDGLFSKLAVTAVPVMALYGPEDVTVPSKNAKKLKSLIPTAQISVLNSGDHGFPYKRYNQVNPVLTDFFEREELKKYGLKPPH